MGDENDERVDFGDCASADQEEVDSNKAGHKPRPPTIDAFRALPAPAASVARLLGHLISSLSALPQRSPGTAQSGQSRTADRAGDAAPVANGTNLAGGRGRPKLHKTRSLLRA